MTIVRTEHQVLHTQALNMNICAIKLGFATSIVGALICLTSSVPVRSISCPSGWLTLEDSCYLFDNTRSVDWITASIQCIMHGASLVEIGSEAENNMLVQQANQLASSKYPGVSFWIGSTDHLAEGEWTWKSDGQSLLESYNNWAPAEPDDAGNQDCALLDASSQFQWSSAKCDIRANAICEKKVTLGEVIG